MGLGGVVGPRTHLAHLFGPGTQACFSHWLLCRPRPIPVVALLAFAYSGATLRARRLAGSLRFSRSLHRCLELGLLPVFSDSSALTRAHPQNSAALGQVSVSQLGTTSGIGCWLCSGLGGNGNGYQPDLDWIPLLTRGFSIQES